MDSTFKDSLAHFAFVTPSPRARKTLTRGTTSAAALGSSSKRKPEGSDRKDLTLGPGLASDEGAGEASPTSPAPNPSPKKKKRVRGYADPETYAHLRGLPDILAEGLDIVFCGINPGEKSAEIGHHYGHHSNHFWDCLYQSGFTPAKLSPEEDHTLPERFSIGLTNLVERPTIEQNELSPGEQAQSVPALLAKIEQFRPRILCFLGLGIAQTFQRQLKFSSKGKIKNSGIGLQGYKLTYPINSNSGTSTAETLFYALPSPSARVIKPQKVGKIVMFSALKDKLEEIKRGEFKTEELMEINLAK